MEVEEAGGHFKRNADPSPPRQRLRASLMEYKARGVQWSFVIRRLELLTQSPGNAAEPAAAAAAAAAAASTPHLALQPVLKAAAAEQLVDQGAPARAAPEEAHNVGVPHAAQDLDLAPELRGPLRRSIHSTASSGLQLQSRG